jgi:hypothetical protein
LASEPYSGWPRVRRLLGLPRLPRISVRCGAALGVCGVAPRTPGWGGPSHPHRVTGMGSTGPRPGDIYAFMRSGVAPQSIER